MKVLKFGGTSVGTPQRMKEVANIVNDGERKIVVLSAVSGTTDTLVQLGKLLYQSDIAKFNQKLSLMEEQYFSFIDELLTDEDLKRQAHEILSSHMNFIDSFSRDMFTVHEERAILAQGELLSTALFHLYCQEQKLNAYLLPALDYMRITNASDPDDYYIKVNLERLLKEHSSFDIYITQGYICRNAYGEIDNLKRGGSDYTASLVGAAAEVDEIQIWTDIDGMHNNDPRFVDKTSPIDHLSFDEAAELAYFGAKILHPSSVRPAQLKNIPVRLKNTMDPEAEGTLISTESIQKNIKAVAAKDGITAIKIKSDRMLLAYGFLRSIFEVFELYKTPIDMITTSEVAVSLTIDEDDQLDNIIKELEKFGKVEVDREQTIICVVGDFLAEKAGFAAEIMTALKEIPLRMVSYGGSKNNVSVVVNAYDKKAALMALNEGLFADQNEEA
tara:strand:+ start:2161 stop:3492 length:1332 start_codon:yes stop_codon:yes gene_type:complete